MQSDNAYTTVRANTKDAVSALPVISFYLLKSLTAVRWAAATMQPHATVSGAPWEGEVAFAQMALQGDSCMPTYASLGFFFLQVMKSMKIQPITQRS